MVKLPEEITANVISHLSEQQTDGSDDQGSGDSHSRSLAHRVHRFVRSVKVDVLLPPYSEDARTRREDGEEKLANDRAFRDVIRKVFALLSSPFPAAHKAQQQEQQLEPGVSPTAWSPKIKLSLTGLCVSDTEDLEERRYRQRVNAISTGDIFEARYESSYLDFSPAAGKTVRDEAEALPELLCVSELDVQATQAPGRRHFAPRVLCLVASRMPGLRSVNWELCDNEKRDVALRKNFAEALESLPPSLQSFYLLYDRRLPMNHSHRTPSILDETDQHGDKLSIALRKLSQRLHTFKLIADVGLEILWPPETEQREENDQPRWPSMGRYSIGLGPIAPSGEWRFQRSTDASDNEDDDDDEGSIDSMQAYEASIAAPGDDREDPFREELDGDAAGQLLLAAARAATCMPNLFSMSFTLSPAVRGDKLSVFYTDSTSGGAGVVELCVESHPVYHPDEEVLRLWREAARVNVGVELEVVIEDSQSW
ncbi:hypothetical protein SLS63_002628 [Diaporthe eres]|uniref:F-box domain-containing protein n=1 Tax=Diaporthe eres TaxID=83184 RepID=A0ABR1PJW3_DIAER